MNPRAAAASGTAGNGSAWVILALGALSAVAPVSIDLYLPGLPQIAGELAGGDARAQLTLSAFLLGFGIGQLLHGPLSDRFGRRGPILAGMTVFTAASVGCALASDLDSIIAFRFLQALGGCAGPVLARASVRDRYEADHAARMLSLMMLVMSVAPMLAPMLGGQLVALFGWRSTFWALALFGAVCVAVTAVAVDESLPPARRAGGSPAQMLRDYGKLLSHRQFMGYTLASGLVFAGMFAYIAASPFVFITLYGVAPQHYGFLFGLNVLGIMLMGAINGRLVVRLGAERLLRWGVTGAALAGTALAVVGWTGWGGLVGLMIPLFGFISTIGLVAANAMARSLALFPQRAGTASALAGTIQFGFGALSGAAAGALADGTARPMTLVMGVAGLASLAILHLLVRRGPVSAPGGSGPSSRAP